MFKIVYKFINTGLGKFLSIFLTFSFTFFITSNFELKNSGLLFLVFSIIQFFVMISRFGQEQVIIKELSKYNHPKKLVSQSIYSSFIIILSISTFFILFNLLFYNFIYEIFFKINFNKYIFIAILPLSLIWLFTGIFKSLNYQFYTNFYENGLLYLVFILGTFFIEKKTNSYINLFLFSSLLSCSIIYINLYFKGLRLNFGSIKQKFKTSLNIALSSLGSYIIINFPIYVSAFFLNTENVTLYTVFLRVSFLVSIGVAIINSYYAPIFAKHYSKNNHNELRLTYSRSRKELILISLIPSIIIISFSGLILNFFSIPISLETKVLLILFTIVQFICISTGPTGLFLNLTDNDKTLKKNIYTGLFLSVILALTLIKPLGILGMLASYCTGVIFENIKSLYSVKKYLSQA